MCHHLEETPIGRVSTSTQGREILPGQLVPSHYNLHIAPNLETFTFDGTVSINSTVVEDTYSATLHSKNLTIHNASITAKRHCDHIDKDLETVTFEFSQLIPAGNSAILYTEFTGIHNDQLAGFYKSNYTDAEGTKRKLVVTQFESTDARQCFPSYDEPALKATFDSTLVVDAELTALSNMPAVGTVYFANSAGKRVKEVKFARTPIMSTYLVAFVVGDLESIETVSHPVGGEPINVRVFTVKGLVNQGEFALNVAARTLEYFSEYFNEAYPLPIVISLRFQTLVPEPWKVKSAKEVGQIFDAISYMKGSSVIRMLNDFLGGQVFMDGVRAYLQEFKYKNTVTADLWKHLSASSGKDIATLMDAWTKETGYPLVSVKFEVYDDEAKILTVTLSQSRFVSGGDLKPEEDSVVWWVPITAVSHLTGKTGATKHVLSEKEGTITFPYDSSSNAFWKLNFGASVAAIGKILETKLETFSVGDRIMFVNDAYSLTSAGLANIGSVLDLIKALEHEQEYNVLSSLTYLESETVREGIKALGRRVFSAKVVQLGYDFPEKEEYSDTLKRGLVIEAATWSGDKNVQSELRARFDKFIAGDAKALHPEIRNISYSSVLANVTSENADATFLSQIKLVFPNLTRQERHCLVPRAV
ncbi:UNVERIFIED_CONTAM: Aminopeptidase 2 mitochondrial [Siphonaria sp. JEL0065]|nr:Aminopeptidase 2 mitochondrial [Siphonaria sp. JEL0065]